MPHPLDFASLSECQSACTYTSQPHVMNVIVHPINATPQV